MKVSIIYGGTSSEKLPSELNAKSIYESLIKSGYDASLLFYDENMLTALMSDRPDIVFLCVQGKYHGDGTLQAMLDFLKIPYTGSGTAAAALINDKITSKILFEHYGHKTPAWYTISKKEYAERSIDFGKIGYPFVGKAPTQGGSFGIGLVRDESELQNLETAFEFDDTILAEGFVSGRAYTVGLLETDGEVTALPCVEMLDKRIDRNDGLILMTEKYSARPAALSGELIRSMEETSAEVFRECGAKDYARVDFMVNEAETEALILEINAVPGLKHSSLYPMEASFASMDYDRLIEHILLNASRRYGLC